MRRRDFIALPGLAAAPVVLADVGLLAGEGRVPMCLLPEHRPLMVDFTRRVLRYPWEADGEWFFAIAAVTGIEEMENAGNVEALWADRVRMAQEALLRSLVERFRPELEPDSEAWLLAVSPERALLVTAEQEQRLRRGPAWPV